MRVVETEERLSICAICGDQRPLVITYHEDDHCQQCFKKEHPEEFKQIESQLREIIWTKLQASLRAERKQAGGEEA